MIQLRCRLTFSVIKLALSYIILQQLLYKFKLCQPKLVYHCVVDQEIQTEALFPRSPRKLCKHLDFDHGVSKLDSHHAVQQANHIVST